MIPAAAFLAGLIVGVALWCFLFNGLYRLSKKVMQRDVETVRKEHEKTLNDLRAMRTIADGDRGRLEKVCAKRTLYKQQINHLTRKLRDVKGELEKVREAHNDLMERVLVMGSENQEL